MQQKKKLYIFVGVVLLIFAGLVGSRLWSEAQPSKYDDFAKCIASSGAKFYGTTWCPHCKEQKELFGSAKQYLPYVECSGPGGQGQTDECKEKGIKGYPTWIFSDGSELSGSLPLEILSVKTGCALEGFDMTNVQNTTPTESPLPGSAIPQAPGTTTVQ